MNNEMSEEDFVLYRDKKDNKIKSLGYTINTVLPYLNMPVMKGGGKIPGRSKENNLTIPVLNDLLPYFFKPFLKILFINLLTSAGI